jgi:hypothetical protein
MRRNHRSETLPLQSTQSLHLEMAAAIVDEWFPEWNHNASRRVDHHLSEADRLEQEGRF